MYFLSVLAPQAFERTTILGANVEASLLYQWFVQCGYRFEEHTEIAAQLRDAPFIGYRLENSYFIPGRPFSKYLRDKPIDGTSLIEQMDRLAIQELRGHRFLYATNNDRAQPRPEWINATPLSVASHGLNTYVDHHAIYFSAALNREPKHYKLLEALGLSAEMIDKSTAHEIIYQTVMRTSLRDPNSTERVLAIVPDEPSARTLAELTSCERVSQLGNLVPSRPPKFTSAQKANRAKAKKLLEKLYNPILVPNSIYNDSGIDSGKYFKGAHSSKVIVTFHKSPYASTPPEHQVKLIDIQVWIGCLRQLSNTILDRKTDGLLFTPAVFDPPHGTEGYRRKEHFILSSFMVLDFDGGSVSPEVVEDIFWSKAKKGNKTSFIMCNSFSRSPEQPNKFRAIILYKRPALSLGEHEAVFDWVKQRLSEAGHSRQVSGLDRNCRSGVQPFWLPCTNRAHPESRFFRQRGTKTKELERCAIDPGEIASSISARRRSWMGNANNSGAIEAAIRQLRSMADGRRTIFFNIGLLYALEGRSRAEVESALREVAGSDVRLTAKIAGVIQSLMRDGRLRRRGASSAMKRPAEPHLAEEMNMRFPSGRLASPEDVLSFWFGTPVANEDEMMTRIHRWFRGGALMDEEVRHRFGPTVEAALGHELDGWAETARGRLALVLLLDQMTRSLYRNDPRCYAGDAHAQALSVEAFDRGMDGELGFIERVFLAMPMGHAEDLVLQERVAGLASKAAANAPPEYRVMSAMSVEQTVKYLGIIRRFGRFPHRNATLGRDSTPDEVEFLKTWAEMQPPKGMGPAS